MFDKLIENLPKILEALTFRRALELIMCAIMVTALYIAWDARASIVSGIRVVAVGHHTSLTAQPATVDAIKSLVGRSSLISGLQLINVNFHSNTRTTVYFFADRSDLQEAIDSAVYNQVAPTPLFIPVMNDMSKEERDYATSNNDTVIAIISADLVCVETSKSLYQKRNPNIALIAPYMCSLSIPPYQGKFAGFMNVFLAHEPSSEEKSTLRDAARALASDIFDQEMSH